MLSIQGQPDGGVNLHRLVTAALAAMPKPASVNSSKEFAVSLLANDAFTSLVEASMRPCYCAAVGVRRRKIGQI